jgi:glycosyltransferase involved in cell wall biosynthesis
MGARTDLNRVDVCIPVHNPDLTYLRSLLDSLCRQSVRDVNVLISDDSVQSSLGELETEYAGSLSLQIRREPPGQGMVHNWNCAVTMGSAPYVVLMGQDDLLFDDALEVHLAELEPAAEVVASGSERMFVDAAGEPLVGGMRVNDRTRVYRRAPSYRLKRHELTLLSLRNGNMLGEPSTVMFRRSAFEEIGGYSLRYEHAVDVDFSLRLAAVGDVVYLARPLARFRKHETSQTNRNIRSGTTSIERVRLIEDYADAGGLSADERARCVAAAALHCLHDAIRGVALRSPAAVKVNLGLLGRLLRSGIRPHYFAGAVVEALSGSNRDER